MATYDELRKKNGVEELRQEYKIADPPKDSTQPSYQMSEAEAFQKQQEFDTDIGAFNKLMDSYQAKAKEADTFYETWKSKKESETFRVDFEQNIQSVRDSINQLKDKYGYDPKLMTKLNRIALDMDKSKSVLQSYEDNWSQWDSQESYDSWKKQGDQLALDTVAYEKETQNIQKQYQNLVDSLTRDWVQFGSQSDFEKDRADALKRASELEDELSQRSTYLKQAKYLQEERDKAAADEQKAREYQDMTEADGFADLSASGLTQFQADNAPAETGKHWFRNALLKGLSGAGNPGTNSLTDASFALATDETWKQPTEEWSKDELDLYGYLYATNREAADEYAIATNNARNRAKSDTYLETAEKFGREHPWLSFAGNVGSGVAGAGNADFIAKAMEQIARGQVTEKSYITPRQAVETASGGASQAFNEKGTIQEGIPVIGGKGWGDVYQLTQSIVQSGALANLTGALGEAGAYLTDAVFFGNSAASAFDEAKSRGATDEQAFSFGFANGLNEALGEHLSIENLIEMKNPHSLVEFAKSVLKQAGIEGSEEVFTSFLNNWADHFVMKDKSQYQLLVKAYMMGENPMTEEEAKRAVLQQMAEDMAFDFVGGFLSGAFSGGFQSGNEYITSNKFYSETYSGSAVELVEDVLEVNPGNTYAKGLQEKLESGKNLTGHEIAKLVEENEATLRQWDTKTIREGTAKRLTELGETGNIDAIAQALTNQVMGEKQTFTDWMAMKESKYGQRVANELNADNIRSGDYASGWARQMDTHTVGQDVYTGQIDVQNVTSKLGLSGKDVRFFTDGAQRSGLSEAEYALGIKEAFEYGREGFSSAQIGENWNSMHMESEDWNYAYKLGMDARRMETVHQQNRQEVNNGTEEVHLRDGSQRADGADSGGTVPGVVQTAERAEGEKRPEPARPGAGGEAAQNVQGRVSTGELGIPGGTDRKTVTFGKVQETEDTQKARSVAAENNLKVDFFTGGDLEIQDEDGTVYRAKGCVVGDQIYVRADHAKNTAAQITRHEVAHKQIEKGKIDAKAAYQQMVEWYGEEGTAEVLRAYADAFEGCQNLSVEEVFEEILCDSVAEMNAFEENGLGQSFQENLREYVKENTKTETAESRGPPADGKTSREFSAESKEFASEIENWYKEGQDEDAPAFILGSTGDVLQGLGAIESDLYMWPWKVNKILQKHPEMSIETIQKIPQILEDPVMILKSRNVGRGKQQNTRLVMFGPVKAEDGKPVMAILDLRPVENKLVINDMQKVSSAYTKDNNPVDFLANSEILHLDKKRTPSLLRTIGFQAPIELQQSGSIGSISYDGQNVNLKGVNFSDVVKERTDSVKASREKIGTAAIEEGQQAQREQLEYWMGKPKMGNGKFARPEDVRRVASTLLRSYNSDAYSPDIRKNLQTLADKIVKDGTDIQRQKEFGNWAGYEQIRDQARLVARDVLKESKVVLNQGMLEVYKDLRSYLRNTKITLTEQSDIADFQDFKRRNKGVLRLSQEGGQSMDVVWLELQDKFGKGFFPDSITHPADQLIHIENMLQNQAKEYINPYYGHMNEAVEHCATDILSMLFSDAVQPVATYMDQELAALDHEVQKRQEKIQELMAGRKEYKSQVAEYYERVSQQGVVERSAKSLMKMLENPTPQAHVPQSLQEPLAEFLNGLDWISEANREGSFSSIRDLDYCRRLANIEAAIQGQREAMDSKTVTEDTAFRMDLPEDLAARISEHMRNVMDATKGLDSSTNKVYEMSSKELKDLGYILRTLNKCIHDIDKCHMEGALARISDVAKSTIRTSGQEKAVKGEHGNRFLWANYTPTRAFEKMGPGAVQILDGFKQGQNKMAFTVKAAIDFAGKTYSEKEVQSWEHEIHTFTIDQLDLNTDKVKRVEVKMTAAQMMSFYCIARRYIPKERQGNNAGMHGLGHLLGGGMRVGNIEQSLKENVQGKELPGTKLVQKEHFRLTDEDCSAIIRALSPRQIEVADKLQRYMTVEGGKLLNEISMARWDYLVATEDFYFPVSVDSDVTEKGNPGQSKENMWALLNKSFTKKPVQDADNAIVINSIFDVYADHMSQTAEYNAFVLPLVDAMKWLNYKDRVEIGDQGQIREDSVYKSLKDTYGVESVNYIKQLILDLNNGQEAGRYEDMMGKLLSNYKGKAVGWNLRVAAQQPTAIMRAGMFLDPVYLVKGVKSKGAVAEMEKYSGIALWKSLGYYELDVGRSVADQIKGGSSLMEKINDAGMWLPGKMDEVTWGVIWTACKKETEVKTGLKGEALLEATAKKFEDVVYHSQVVDSVLTRSGLMRSKSQTVKEMTSFMAEPTMSINIMESAFEDYRDGKITWEKARKTLKIGFYGYVLPAVVNACIVSLFDAGRDDDEYESFWEKYKQALLGQKFTDGNIFSELNPLDKMVAIKDFVAMLKGEEVKNSSMSLFQTAYNLSKDMVDLYNGESKKEWYGHVYEALEVLGYATGAAPSNALREAVSIWNSTFGTIQGLKIHKYKIAEKEKIRRAYLGKALTDAEAKALLVEKGEAENENDAYFIIRDWTADKTEKGKYKKLYNAAFTGSGFDEELKNLTDHGIKEKDARSELVAMVGENYRGEKITRETAESMLAGYSGLDSDDQERLLNKWKCKVDTGIVFEDIQKKYVDKKITAERARQLYVTYGGYSEKDAKEKVDSWLCERETGVPYGNIESAYVDEEITGDQASRYLKTYGGLRDKDIQEKMQAWDCEKETGVPYSGLEEAYAVDKDLSAEQAEAYLQKYGDMDRFKAEKKVLEWTCERETEVKFSGLKDAYLREVITEKQAVDSLKKYGGDDDATAKAKVKKWQCNKETEIEYSDIETCIQKGILTKSKAADMMVKYGGLSRENADLYAELYEWKGSSLEGARDMDKNGIDRWYKEGTGRETGISKATFTKWWSIKKNTKGVDADGDGKTDANSVASQVIPMIGKLPISSEEKWQIALSFWAKSTVKKFKNWS